MQESVFSKQIDKLVLKPSARIIGLKNIISSIFDRSNSDLEFLARLRIEIGELMQYTLDDIALLPDEICINEDNYNLFRKVLMEIKSNLAMFETKRIRGSVKSLKNSVEFSFLFEYYLDYVIDYDANAFIFLIWEEGRELEDKFSFRLRIMENDKDLKVVDLFSDSSNYYTGKGISIAIILQSKEMFNKRIISSSNKLKTFIGEANYKDAIEKVWKKMIEKGLALYNSECDYYFTI